MSLLTVVQNVADETLIAERPATVIGNNDKFARQCLSLLKKVGHQLMKRHDWEALTKTETITLDGSGSYTIGTDIFTDGDFDRIVAESEWDSSSNKKVKVLDPKAWGFLTYSAISATGVTTYLRVRGGKVLISPDTSGDTIDLEYISNFWSTTSGGTAQATLAADTDLFLFEEELLELGLAFRLKAARSLPSLADAELFKEMTDLTKAGDVPNEILGPTADPLFVVNVPDTGVGG